MSDFPLSPAQPGTFGVGPEPKSPVVPPRVAQLEIPAVLERYELKYTIPREWVEPITEFIKPYCDMDAYSARCADGFYRVNSLYLDSPDLIFLRTKMCGAARRFNMRVRTYGENPGYPYFFEIKHKNGDTIRKVRAVIREGDLEDVIFGSPRPGEDPTLALCRKEAITYNVQPWVQTRYLRKAFISHCDDYARVTFDRGLEYAPRERFDPIPVDSEMTPSDIDPLFDPETNVILELKCYTSYVPSWMIDLIRHFELRRRGFSKYAAGVVPAVQRFGFDPIAFERFGGDFS